MVLFLLRQEEQLVRKMGESIIALRSEIKYCKKCNNVSDTDLCNICSNPKRDASLICVVEDLRDVMAIENTAQYQGVYHVIGGLINPIQGIGPDKLQIESLLKRVVNEKPEEIILALSATMEGDTTAFFLSRKLQQHEVRISAISRGIAVGGELEYADEITLGRSITSRIPYIPR